MRKVQRRTKQLKRSTLFSTALSRIKLHRRMVAIHETHLKATHEIIYVMFKKRSAAECFRSDKARTASFLNGLKKQTS